MAYARARQVLGIDIASFGVVENLEAAVAVGALALSQVPGRGMLAVPSRRLSDSAVARSLTHVA